MTFYFGVLRNQCVGPRADVSQSRRCCMGTAPAGLPGAGQCSAAAAFHESKARPLARAVWGWPWWLVPSRTQLSPQAPAGQRWQQGGSTTGTRDSSAVRGPLPHRATGQGAPGRARCPTPRDGACLSWEGATAKGSPGLPQPLW